MSAAALSRLIQAAQVQGLLPATAQAEPAAPSWAVTLLNALGAWLCALLLLLPLGFLLGAAHEAVGILGLLLVAPSLFLLRRKTDPVFLEHLLVAALLVGLGLIAWSLSMLFTGAAVPGLVSALLLLAGGLSAQAWLRVMLGAAAAAAAGLALVGWQDWMALRLPSALAVWLALHLMLAAVLGVAAAMLQVLPPGRRAHRMAKVENLCTGWLVVTLLGLAAWSGSTFLVGAPVVPSGGALWHGGWPSKAWQHGTHALSALWVVLGAAWLLRRWPVLRRPWCGGACGVLVGLAAAQPSLGACLLVLALCAGTGRWRLALLAALAAVWTVGAFYYALSWPLVHKALGLGLAAALLAVLVVWGGRSDGLAPTPSARPHDSGSRPGWAALLSAALALAVVNTGVWQKEQIVRHGQVVFVALAPVDPRSLMQGDYMRLAFDWRVNGQQPSWATDRPVPGRAELRVVLKRDSQGIATVQGLDQGQALAPGELRIALVPRHGRWTLVTDAFYFKEGQASRWAAARYGEFRVDAQGQAVLVGLRGEQLRPL